MMTDDQSEILAVAKFAMTDDRRVGHVSTVPRPGYALYTDIEFQPDLSSVLSSTFRVSCCTIGRFELEAHLRRDT